MGMLVLLFIILHNNNWHGNCYLMNNVIINYNHGMIIASELIKFMKYTKV